MHVHERLRINLVLGAGDPKHQTHGVIGLMADVHISLVQCDDFTGLDPGTQFPSALGIIVPGSVHKGKTGQETLQIQPQMTLGRRRAGHAVKNPGHCVHEWSGAAAGNNEAGWPAVGWTEPARHINGASFAAGETKNISLRDRVLSVRCRQIRRNEAVLEIDELTIFIELKIGEEEFAP
ncbi:MAG: hypothetical protein WCH99_00965 [Verrucomicrobiota bacterium]